ncbi:glutathione degradosome [Coniophora puteana RWD-64-598 SS2]|uniref:Glutathione degradosome n=1 Tax=Coniophora puteana (strain RWD-64-598) TaxID=741705 RepID=A0A5M3MQ97_CONPW|nr:glutathione degradosome [Coniophora puteana RWD-64-598 SS2]EIW81236.1 glutathione degradosome [Coniophora puteana RWD-64-598 SS2]
MANLPPGRIPHPSVSRNIPGAGPLPQLVHSLSNENNSVLCIMADATHIFTGGQCPTIQVWDKQSFTLKTTLNGHTASVLALEYAKEKCWLFSAAGDSTVRIWSTKSLAPLYVLHPYLETGAGDLFSLAWSPSLQTVYVGCQNTSLQWFSFNAQEMKRCHSEQQVTSGNSTPNRRPHKFFDSYPQYQHRPADIYANNSVEVQSSAESLTISCSALHIPPSNVIDSAHYGYIYCMALLPSYREGSDDEYPGLGMINLITGSGDETVKMWECSPTGLKLVYTYECQHGAVLSLAARREIIYAGCQDGYVKVLDPETRTLVRTLIVQENVDVLSLSLMYTDLYTCSANGQIQASRFSASFDCTASWKAHNGIILSSLVTRFSEYKGFFMVSGANDGFVNVWDIIPPEKGNSVLPARPGADRADEKEDSTIGNDTLTHVLSTFVSIPSVSSDPAHREDCRQAAIWLKKCLHQLGAESGLLPCEEGVNPLVLATFVGTQGKHPKKRLLFYGHYDVIPAPSAGWKTDPFTATGHNGYLYGRGVSDDKGPVLAVACAAADLLRQRALGVDVVFLIEGEEEHGSRGFMDAVKKHKVYIAIFSSSNRLRKSQHLIGDIDAILVSNSTWIAESPPCITYGLRGVVHCTVEVSSTSPDLHSGIEGGAASEPMQDLIQVLAALGNGQRKVTVPHFYDCVRPMVEDEKQMYNVLSQVAQRPMETLSSRWREPACTVHSINVSGPGNSTVIPSKVYAKVSLRLVPDQDIFTITKSLVEHLEQSFRQLQSPNQLKVTIDRTADWWIGDLNGPWFKALETAVRDEWGQEPLRIREGGSIPSIPNLEKEFGCQALHLPLGQSTDQAHLPNERISLINLRRGKTVIERFLTNIADASFLMPGGT